jgi:hypothetical protein
MYGRVVDYDGSPLNGVTVSIRDTSVDANMTSGANGTPGGYASLQYRAQSATVSAYANQWCNTSTGKNAWPTAASNKGPFTRNQFGLIAGGQMEQKDPIRQGWNDLKLDTRHSANITLTGGTAAKDTVAGLHYTLNGNAISYADLQTHVLKRGVAYTLSAKGDSIDQGEGSTTFTIPTSYTWGKPFDVKLDMNMATSGVK